MKTLLAFLVFFILFESLLAYEAYRLPLRSRMRYELNDVSLFRPHVNAYGGPVRQKVVINCKTRAERRPTIQWYRFVPDNSTCGSRSKLLTTTEGSFCTETRTKFFVRPKSKYTSKLVLRRPRKRDSGIYMCVISMGQENITLTTKLSFHGKETPPVRLVDSAYGNVGEGRVELLINKNWRGVQIYTWESPEASLICRLLGYKYGGEPRFTYKDGNSYTYSYKNQRNLLSPDCPLNSTGLNDCTGLGNVRSYGPPAGVTCRRTPVKVPTKQVRFAGMSPSEGRVEVYSQGLWGTVCMKGLTDREIYMICRSMGYNYGGVSHKAWASSYNYASIGVGPIMLSGLRCPANASDLEQCTYNTLGTACCNCSHNDDLAVRCRVRPGEGTPRLRVRLAAYGSDIKGRVEVYHDGMWSTVSAYWLQEAEANMFCKMLGFQYGGEAMIATSGFETTKINFISCPLNATTIEDCSVTYTGIGRGMEAGGVICREEPLEVPEIPFRIGNNNAGTEKLQYYAEGYWGTVCGAYIGTPEASMVCSMMGYRYGGSFITSSERWSYRGLGPILLKYLDCPMNSTHIDHCHYRNYTDYDHRIACYSYTDHKKDVNIRCNDNPQNTDIPVRLNGTEANRGILQVFREDRWRFVSFAKNPALASVVCRQLGFSNGGEIYKSFKCLREGGCDVQGFLSGYSECTGKEDHIGQCNSLLWDKYWWSGDRPAAIHCYLEDDNPFEVSLKDTEDNGRQGTVVLTKNGESFLICAKLWDDIHARAYCMSAGYSDGTAMYYKERSRSRYPTVKMILAMYCQRGVASLHRCYHTGGENQYYNECFSTGSLKAGVSCIP